MSDDVETNLMSGTAQAPLCPVLPKAPTPIRGLDEIARGVLPRGRTTSVTGGTGAGKTLLGLQLLVAGAREYGEPGSLLTFEESTAKVTANIASLGFDLDALRRDPLLIAEPTRARRRRHAHRPRSFPLQAAGAARRRATARRNQP
jgi:circadian clock protein KaiC